MKLTVSRSKNAASLYVTKSMYVNGTRTSKIVEKLGTEAELRKKLNGADPYEWANASLNQALNALWIELLIPQFLHLNRAGYPVRNLIEVDCAAPRHDLRSLGHRPIAEFKVVQIRHSLVGWNDSLFHECFSFLCRELARINAHNSSQLCRHNRIIVIQSKDQHFFAVHFYSCAKYTVFEVGFPAHVRIDCPG